MGYIRKKELNQLLGYHCNLKLENMGFKWRRSKNEFIKYLEGGAHIFNYRILDSYDFEKDEVAWSIEVDAFIRFNVVHEWFEQFEHRSKKDYKDSWTTGKSLIGSNGTEFVVAVDEENMDHLINEFITSVVLKFCEYIQNNNSLEKVNNLKMPFPIISDTDIEKLSSFNIRVAFELLTIAWILQRDDFESMLSVFRSKLNELEANGDPMVKNYLPRFDEIITTLKNVDFDNELKILQT